MDIHFFEQLERDAVIDKESLANVQLHEEHKLFSVHWELTTLLSLGILLFCTGAGIFIYKNIDSIGHITIVGLIAVLMVSCFVYCFRKANRYSNEKVESPNIWYDYVLLLGSLLLITFIGYIQFQFHFFGDRWGLATFVPVIVLFSCAYYFDHLGVLSLAITNLAAWIGITVSPMQLLSHNDFGNENIIYSGILVSILLLGLTALSLHRNIKAHFAPTYKNFGIHLCFVSILAAVFHFESIYFLWFLLLAAVSAYQWVQAVRHRSFYFLLVTILYFYIGLSYVILRALISSHSGEANIYIAMLYVIFSSAGLIGLLIHYNKKLHRHDSL